MKLLLLGSTGLVGQAMAQEARSRGWILVAAARSGAGRQLDISDDVRLEGTLAEESPDLVVNCAALVDIQRCEADPGLAYRTNARPLALLADWSRRTGGALLHISTDHFYTEGTDRAHPESDPVSLINDYARSKYAGEGFALVAPGALVLRTSIVGIRGWEWPTFAEWAIDAVLNDRNVTLFADAYTSSIDVRTFSKAALDLQASGARGLLNLAAAEVYSKEHFVREVARQLGRELTTAASGTVASLTPPRPSSLGLDVTGAQRYLGYALPLLPSVVASVIDQYRE